MDTKNDDFALLIFQSGPLMGDQRAITTETIVGRDLSCDIVIPDRQVSRIHARFTIGGDGIYLEDMGSKNGVHLNGELVVEPTLLQDGDVIQIALVQQFLYLSSDATVPLDKSQFEVSDRGSAKSRMVLDSSSHRVWLMDKELDPPLSASQFLLLETLYENAGNVVPRQELITRIWGAKQAVEISEQALDALIRRLRDRLSDIDADHIYIITVRGHGLRLDNPREN